MELDTRSIGCLSCGGLTMTSVDKVYLVQTIGRVAEVRGGREDWLWDVANEMEQEDGLIWVYGLGLAVQMDWRRLSSSG